MYLAVLGLLLCLGTLPASPTMAGAAGETAEQHPRRELSGIVRDAATQEPIPFANIGFKSAGVGTVADENGRYRMDSPLTSATATISAIGYRPETMSLQALQEAQAIELTALEYLLEEKVVVTAKAGSDKERILGKRYEPQGFGVGFASGLLGTEIGRRVKINRPTLIRSANFGISHTRADKFLFRVNVYDFSHGEVGANLLKQNVIVTAPTEKGTLSVDLSEYLLVLEDDVLLSLEWIKGDNQTPVPPLMFRARRTGSAPIYMRLTSHAAIEELATMSLGFYLVGVTLD